MGFARCVRGNSSRQSQVSFSGSTRDIIFSYKKSRKIPSRMLWHHEVLVFLPVPGEDVHAALPLPQHLAHGEAGGCLSLSSHTEPLSASLLPPSSSSRSICSGCFFPELQKLHFSKLNFLWWFFFFLISPGSPSDCFAPFHPLQFIIFYECY